MSSIQDNVLKRLRKRGRGRVFIPKELPAGSRTSAMVFQALRHLGQAVVDSQEIARLRRSLSPKQQRELVRDARYTTDWIAAVDRALHDDRVDAIVVPIGKGELICRRA